MARLNAMDRLGAALRAQQPAMRPPARAPGDVTTPPTPGTPRGDLLAIVAPGASLPSDSRLSDAIVTALMTPPVDPATVKAKFREIFCVPPGAFYCEAERTAWMNANPWCAGVTVPLVVTPTFTSDVERNAWIATHPGCPVPPVLTDHMCTPGDPGCGPAPTSTQQMAPTDNGIATFVLGIAVATGLWWIFTPSAARTNPTEPSETHNRVKELVSRATRMTTHDDPNAVFQMYDVYRGMKRDGAFEGEPRSVADRSESRSKLADEAHAELAEYFLDYMTAKNRRSPNDGRSPRLAPADFKGISKVQLGRVVAVHFSK